MKFRTTRFTWAFNLPQKFFGLALGLLLMSSGVWGQTAFTAYIDDIGATTCPASNTNFGDNLFTNLPAGVSFSGFTRSVVGCGSASSHYRSTNYTSTSKANAISENRFVSWTLTANASVTFTLSETAIRHERSGAGAENGAIYYSINGAAFTQVGGDFTITEANGRNVLTFSSPVTIPASGNIEFRFYAWRTATSGAGNVRIKGGSDYATGSGVIGTFTATANPATNITSNFSTFAYALNNGPSTEQSYTVSGSNLTNDIVLSVPSNFEHSLNAAGPYQTSNINLAPSSGSVASTTVYVRLVTGLGAGSYNDNISVTSDDPSSPASIAVTGEVLSETLPYFESFGTTAGVFPLGWTTSGPGATNWVVNGTSASPSGGNNIGDAGANITNQEAIITVNRAISTVGADEVFISFLARRTAAYSGSMLFDYSINGTDWFNVPFADVANDGNWGSVGFSLPSAAAGVANLRLRFRTTRTNSSGNYRIDDFRVLAPARFVYQSGPLHQTTSWEDADTDNPADFTSDNQLFVIEGSTTVSTTDAWTVSGSNSRIILGDATNSATLTITDDNAITGTIQVRNNAVLNLNNTTLPTLSGLEDASTVVYGMNAAATIQSVAYGNLTVTGSGIKTFPNSTIAVNGNLTWTDVTLGFGGSNARIDYAGNITLSGTVDYDGGIRPEFRVTANSAAQSITTNGQTLEAFNFYAQNKTGGSLNITSGSAIQALNNMRLNFPAGVSFNDGGNTLVFGDDFRIEGDVASYTLNGTFKLLASSGTNDFENIQVALNNLEIETTGTSDPQFADGSNTNDITINGNLVLNIAGNNLVMNGVTLRVGGNITDNSAADKIDAGTSTLVLNGTAAQAISINSAMNNLTIDKSAGTATINSDLALNNLLTLTVGVLDANGHLILKSTSATQTAQVIGGNNSNLIGDVIAERFLPWSSANNNGFRFVSHPLRANPVFNTVSNLPTANNTLIGYDEAGNAYVGINNRGNSWPQGVGYGVWANAVNTLEFIGALQLSDLNNISMSNTNNRWNYAGNPFPSVLDWEEVTLNDMQDAVWVWVKDDVAEGGGVWAAYVDGVSTDGGSQYIAPMQGFMVRALASGSPSISFPATARVSGQSPAYQRVSTTADLLRVNLRKAANGSEMQTIIRFRPQASNSFDASFDAEFVSDFMNATPDLYTTDAQGVKYSINSLEPLGAQPVLVPLQVETFGAGEFSFAFNSSAMISGASIQLEDTKLGSFSTINDGDVVSFTAAATDAVDRFRLHFNGMATSVHDSQLDQLNMYAHEGILYIRGIEQAEQLRIMDMTGRKVFEAHQLQIQAEGVRPNLSKGTYLVQLVSPSGVKTVKVIF